MSKKNQHLRSVPLARVRATIEKHYTTKKSWCHERALENAACWSELHPYEVVRDFFAALTPEGYKQFLELLYPENPPNATIIPKEKLYRYRHRFVDGTTDQVDF